MIIFHREGNVVRKIINRAGQIKIWVKEIKILLGPNLKINDFSIFLFLTPQTLWGIYLTKPALMIIYLHPPPLLFFRKSRAKQALLMKLSNFILRCPIIRPTSLNSFQVRFNFRILFSLRVQKLEKKW